MPAKLKRVIDGSDLVSLRRKCNGLQITDVSLDDINSSGVMHNFANADLTLDATRTHDTQLNSLIISADGATLANEWFSLASRAAYLGFSNSYDRFTNTGLDTFILGVNRFSMTTAETVINEAGGNHDTRIEGDLDQYLFFTDASVDKIGVGTNAPSAKLDVFDTSSTTQSGISSETAGATSSSITNAVAGSNGRTGGATMNNGGYFRAYNNSNNNTGVLGLVGSTWTTPVSDVGVFGNVSSNGTNLSDSRAGYFRNEGTAAASATRYGVYGTVVGTETGDSLGAYFANSASSAGVSNGYAIDASITGNNAVNTALRLSSSGGTTNYSLVSLQGGVVFNESATDSDFRIEGQTDANLVFVDASTDRVGIGTNAPASKLHITSSSQTTVRVESTGGEAILRFSSAAGQDSYILNAESGVSKYLHRYDASANKYHIYNYTVAAYAFVINDSSNYVGIGQNTASYPLDVLGDINSSTGYRTGGTAGISGTYTFGGGGSGDIASMTFNGGILTAVTTVP